MFQRFKAHAAKFLANFVPQAVTEQIIKNRNAEAGFQRFYYSQEGEEIILRRFFNYKNNGLFVDIGAHHPLRFSNTYVLYMMGWRGINIDATPGSMREFNKQRKEDINIEAAISDKEEQVNFFMFNEAALNTFDEKKAHAIINAGKYKLLNTSSVLTQTLAKTLEQHIAAGTEIDFFTIDAEGFDLKILKSNDWNKFKPRVIVIESANMDIDHLHQDEICIFLTGIGYKAFAKTFKSVFYYC